MTSNEELVWIIEWLARQGVPVPIALTGSFRGRPIEATVDSDGVFHWRGERFDSPSVAAGQIATSTSGERTPDRRYLSINGWKFWTVRLPNGDVRSLSDLRDLVEAK